MSNCYINCMGVVSYPMFDLSTIVEILNKAIKAGASVDKQILANASTQSNSASTTSGIFNQKLAAFKHYNLAKVENNLVKFTPLAQQISSNSSGAIETAFLAPTTFKELHTSVEKNVSLNRSLMEDVAHLQIGITNAGKKKFVKNYIKSGIYAGLIEHSLKSKDEFIVFEKSSSSNSSLIGTPTLKENGGVDQRAELKISKGRAVLMVPDILTNEDKDRLKKQIDLF